MKQEEVEIRKERGREIAKNSRINQKGNKWTVPSQTGIGAYSVVSNGFEATCTCPPTTKPEDASASTSGQ